MTVSQPDPYPKSAAALRLLAEGRLDRRVAAEGVPVAGLAQSSTSEAETQRLLHELQVHQIELELQNEELKESRDLAEKAAARFTDLYDFAPVGYLTLDRVGNIKQANLAAAQLLGCTRADLVGKRLGSWVVEAETPEFSHFLWQSFVVGAQPGCELTLLVDHQTVAVQCDARVSGDGQECWLVLADITRRKQSDQALRLYASVYTHSREGIMITDAAGKIVEVNDAFTRNTGYSRSEIQGQNPRILQSGHQSEDFYASMWHALRTEGHWAGEVWNRRKSGEIYAEMQTVTAVSDAAGQVQNFISLSLDITSTKLHLRELEHKVHHDLLTGLPNRLLLADRLGQALLHGERRGQALGVAFVDLDGFKAVNDRYGHDMGDQLLVALAQRLKSVLREGDTLARLGGDEFVVLLVDVEKSGGFDWVLGRMLEATAQAFVVRGTALQVTASIGVVRFPQHGATAGDLLRHADRAMYKAKQAGGNQWHHFDASTDSDEFSDGPKDDGTA